MNTAERPDFEHELGKLCAGFNVPLTPERKDAYWTGLGKMSLLSFRRVVEHTLGDEYDGDESKPPTAPQCWRIYRTMRKPDAKEWQAPANYDPSIVHDDASRALNFVLMSFVGWRKDEQITDEEARYLFAHKEKLAAQYRQIIVDEKQAIVADRPKILLSFARALHEFRLEHPREDLKTLPAKRPAMPHATACEFEFDEEARA